MDGYFSDVQHILKNGLKSDSFAAHDEKNFNVLHHERTNVSVWR